MKRTVRDLVACLLIAAMCLSLCSCNVFKTMRENAERASRIQIAETPDDAQALRLLRELIGECDEMGATVKENVSYKADNPHIYTADGEEAGLLDDAAKQLRDLITANKPGSAENELAAGELRLMEHLDAAGAPDVRVERNYNDEKVTDEKGNYVADEDGNVVTEKKVADNVLHFTIDYYHTEVTGQITKDDGTTEDVTEIVPADTAAIESVFGEPADKEAVLAAFEAVADYVTVSDYEIAYTNCQIRSDVDLDESLVSFVRFEKHMTVTAKATCVGKLAEYGEVTVILPLTKTIEYSFDYPAAE
ncbi:MAG: hypothetical protein IJK89_04680 [Clostridia bacterium]|nr:hypothetical protein [Clostridia bacterium]